MTLNDQAWVFVWLLAISFNSVAATAQTPTTSATNLDESDLPVVLKHMPMNSDLRCVGISSVAEALLEGRTLRNESSEISLDQLAKSIFDGLSTDEAINYPAQLKVRDQLRSITDTEVLNKISSRVAELYKAETTRIADSPAGLGKIKTAQAAVLRSEEELHGALDADRDQTELFCCFGYREFPDGTYKQTLHAVVMRKSDQGKIFVFDSNDPGEPIACSFHTFQGELIAEWSCGFRNHGYETTQRYRLVPKSVYFKIARN